MPLRIAFIVSLLGVLRCVPVVAAPQTLSPALQQVAHDVLRDVVNINTSVEGTGTTAAAQTIVARLTAAGFADADMHLVGTDPRNQNLIVRYRGTGSGRPILLIAHLDTVPAHAADWTTDPFVFTEKDGWWYGRGIVDDKTGVGTLVTNLVGWKMSGFHPTRDLIVLLTTAEETDAAAGMEWVVNHRRDLIDAEYCLNTDGGGGLLEHDRPVLFRLQAAEKVYQSYRLEVTNAGGHSSMPRADNAIYQLSAALTKLAAFSFPVQLTEVTREFFTKTAAIQGGQLGDQMRAIVANPQDAGAAARLSEQPWFNALLRTTCVATRLEAGHADNALPQRATAVVNCRILPGVEPDSVRRTLDEVIADPAVKLTPVEEATPSPPSPLQPAITGVIERVIRDQWGVGMVPTMETGATDGLYLRNAGIPTYGVGGLFLDAEEHREHGRDERVEPNRYYDAVAFWDRMVRTLAGGQGAPSETGGR
jgi:acetylornithine deacetylase/succinyl-diaminopimelate desuccinylase-like protein